MKAVVRRSFAIETHERGGFCLSTECHDGYRLPFAHVNLLTGSARPVVLRFMFICILSTHAKDFWLSRFICTSAAWWVYVLAIRNMLNSLNLLEVVTM